MGTGAHKRRSGPRQPDAYDQCIPDAAQFDGRPDARMRELAEPHAEKAERLPKSRWISDHIKAQAHATLAANYERRRSETVG
jgi:hypothetical protein